MTILFFLKNKNFCHIVCVRFRYSSLPLHLNRWRFLLKPYNGKFFNELQWVFEFLSGSDACAVLLRVWWIHLPEVPPVRICNLWHSKPCWDLNHGHRRLIPRKVFVVSGLNGRFCVYARFRCSLLPLHLNRWRCLLKPCNRKFINELQRFLRVLFRFRCLCCFVARLVDTPARSASRVHLHSAVFHARLGSEPWVQF